MMKKKEEEEWRRRKKENGRERKDDEMRSSTVRKEKYRRRAERREWNRRRKEEEGRGEKRKEETDNKEEVESIKMERKRIEEERKTEEERIRREEKEWRMEREREEMVRRKRVIRIMEDRKRRKERKRKEAEYMRRLIEEIGRRIREEEERERDIEQGEERDEEMEEEEAERRKERERERRREEIRRRREEELEINLKIQNKKMEEKIKEKNSKIEIENDQERKKKPRRKKTNRTSSSSSCSSSSSPSPCNSKAFLLLGKGSPLEGLVGWKVKGQREVIQLHPETNEPCGRSFVFDRVFLYPHPKTIYTEAIQKAIRVFCTRQRSLAVILYGASDTTGKNWYLSGVEGQPRGILQRSFADILAYLKTVRTCYCMLRVSYVEIYNERVEDLLTTYSYGGVDGTSPDSPQQPAAAPPRTPGHTQPLPPPLRLERDAAGRVVWCGAREVTVSRMEELEDLYALGRNEHLLRARRTKGRQEAAHQVFRIILETVPRFTDYPSWESVSVCVSFLDFVVVGGLELLPTLSNVTEELRGGPPVTRSLYALHHYVLDHAPAKNALHDGRQTTLTRILQGALAGDSHSLFLCTCSPRHTQHTLHTLRFGDASKSLLQHPTRHTYTNSLLHATIRQILTCYQAARRGLRGKNKTTTSTTSTTTTLDEEEEDEEEEEEVKEEVEEEVQKMMSLASNIFPINTRKIKVESEEARVLKKRGRPRKCPIKIKPFVPLRQAKIDYIALWKSHYLDFCRGEDVEKKRKKEKERKEEKIEVIDDTEKKKEEEEKAEEEDEMKKKEEEEEEEEDEEENEITLIEDKEMKKKKKEEEEEENTEITLKEDPKHKNKEKKKEKKKKIEKFFMAGQYDLTTTTKPKLTTLYRIGSLRESDPSSYYGGYLNALKGWKEEEEEDREKRENEEEEEWFSEDDLERKEKEEEEMREKKETEETRKEEEKEKERERRKRESVRPKERGNIEKKNKQEKKKERGRENATKPEEKEKEERERENKQKKKGGGGGGGGGGARMYLKGTITITRKWDVCVDGAMRQFLDPEYQLKDYRPKQVSFNLSNLVYREPKWKLDDGYVHLLRLSLWIQYFRHSLAQRTRDGRLVYAMPDFISLKEVFLDIFLTPYRRTARLWRLKAVSYEDGRVYLQSDVTMARQPEKLSAKAALTTHLMGHLLPDTATISPTTTTTSTTEKRSVPFSGQYWEVYWGEVDGLGLCYSSQVDLLDRASQFMQDWTSSSSSSSSSFPTPAMCQLLKVFSKRHFMYRTQLYPPPRDTKAWKERMWFTLLEWWADYQFGRVPSIIGGELEGEEVTAIRLFCAQTLPQLAEAWCEKPAWDPTLGAHYLSSLLRFVKYWCNRWTRETLSFELQPNGNVLCCRRKFKIASQHFLVDNILPDQYVKDLYPAPPRKPKPNWPGKRGRKWKAATVVNSNRPRPKMCYWKLPRFSEVETGTPDSSPPRFVFRPGTNRDKATGFDKGMDFDRRRKEGAGSGWDGNVLNLTPPKTSRNPRRTSKRTQRDGKERGQAENKRTGGNKGHRNEWESDTTNRSPPNRFPDQPKSKTRVDEDGKERNRETCDIGRAEDEEGSDKEGNSKNRKERNEETDNGGEDEAEGRDKEGDRERLNTATQNPTPSPSFPNPQKTKINYVNPRGRPRSRPPPPKPTVYLGLPRGLTRPQTSRWVNKRARDWYKSTLPGDLFPKQLLEEEEEEEEEEEGMEEGENGDEVEKYLRDVLFSSASSHSETDDEREAEATANRLDETLFTPLLETPTEHKLADRKPEQHSKRAPQTETNLTAETLFTSTPETPTRHKRGKRKPKQHSSRTPISEDDGAYETLWKYTLPIIDARQRKIPRLKGLQRVPKILPVPPVPEDDDSYARKKKKWSGDTSDDRVVYRGNLSLEKMMCRGESEEEEEEGVMGVL